MKTKNLTQKLKGMAEEGKNFVKRNSAKTLTSLTILSAATGVMGPDYAQSQEKLNDSDTLSVKQDTTKSEESISAKLSLGSSMPLANTGNFKLNRDQLNGSATGFAGIGVNFGDGNGSFYVGPTFGLKKINEKYVNTNTNTQKSFDGDTLERKSITKTNEQYSSSASFFGPLDKLGFRMSYDREKWAAYFEVSASRSIINQKSNEEIVSEKYHNGKEIDRNVGNVEIFNSKEAYDKRRKYNEVTNKNLTFGGQVAPLEFMKESNKEGWLYEAAKGLSVGVSGTLNLPGYTAQEDQNHFETDNGEVQFGPKKASLSPNIELNYSYEFRK